MRSMTYPRNSCSSGYMPYLFMVSLKFVGNMCPDNLIVARVSKNDEKRLIASSCLSARSKHWTDFHKILYIRTFLTSVEKIQFSLTPD